MSSYESTFSFPALVEKSRAELAKDHDATLRALELHIDRLQNTAVDLGAVSKRVRHLMAENVGLMWDEMSSSERSDLALHADNLEWLSKSVERLTRKAGDSALKAKTAMGEIDFASVGAVALGSVNQSKMKSMKELQVLPGRPADLTRWKDAVDNLRAQLMAQQDAISLYSAELQKVYNWSPRAADERPPNFRELYLNGGSVEGQGRIAAQQAAAHIRHAHGALNGAASKQLLPLYKAHGHAFAKAYGAESEVVIDVIKERCDKAATLITDELSPLAFRTDGVMQSAARSISAERTEAIADAARIERAIELVKPLQVAVDDALTDTKNLEGYGWAVNANRRAWLIFVNSPVVEALANNADVALDDPEALSRLVQSYKHFIYTELETAKEQWEALKAISFSAELEVSLQPANELSL